MIDPIAFGSQWFGFMAPAAIRGIVILVITWAIVSLLRRQAANLRSLVSTIGLAAALIAPLLGYQPVTLGIDIPDAVRARFSTEQQPAASELKVVPLSLPDSQADAALLKGGRTTGSVGITVSDTPGQAPVRPPKQAQNQSPGQSQGRPLGRKLPAVTTATTATPALPTPTRESATGSPEFSV